MTAENRAEVGLGSAVFARLETIMNDEFAARSEEYEKRSIWVSDEFVHSNAIRLLTSTGRIHFGNILDAGGGTGALAKALASRLGYDQITVIDISPSMLARVPSQFEKTECAIESIATLNRRFDTILLRQVLHYVHDPCQALAALFDVLSHDGTFYIGQIVAPNDESAIWLQNIASQISPRRRRVWQISDLVSILLGTGMKMGSASLHPFSDSLRSWMKRSTVQVDQRKLLESAKNSLDKANRNCLGILEQKDDISFEVLFFHAIFTKRK